MDNILGNELIKQSMVSSVSLGRVSHAYIICGPAGSGKRLLANAFGKAILCGAYGSASCGLCKSCKTYDTGNNPDAVFITPQKQTLGVKEVREDILENLSILPYESDKRVYIINDAHKMTPAAQNAMLLTLEDGPEFAVFMLLADGLGSFLPTLLSRCIQYKIQPLSEDIIRSHLASNGISSGKAQIAAGFAHGSLGRALALAGDEDFMALRSFVLDLAHRLDTGKMDIPEIFAAAKSLEQYKDQIFVILDILKFHYRNGLLCGNNPVIAINKIHAIDDIKEKLGHNCNYLLCMEILLLKCRGDT
jgi:DNA polymerase-3 subunit delta'